MGLVFILCSAVQFLLHTSEMCTSTITLPSQIAQEKVIVTVAWIVINYDSMQYTNL